MTVQTFLWIIGAALVSVCANMLFRASYQHKAGVAGAKRDTTAELALFARRPLVWIGALLYLIAALIWLHVTSTEDLTPTFALLVAASFIGTTIARHFIFGEPLTARKTAGLIVVMVGVALLIQS